jgi:hypothetical protein
MSQRMQPSWLILVGTNSSLVFPPELYGSASAAEREASRWRLGLEQLREIPQEANSWGRVSETVIVEVVSVESEGGAPWVGLRWIEDEESLSPVLMSTRAEAARWLGWQAGELGCNEMAFGELRLTAAVQSSDLPRVEVALAKQIAVPLTG